MTPRQMEPKVNILLANPSCQKLKVRVFNSHPNLHPQAYPCLICVSSVAKNTIPLAKNAVKVFTRMRLGLV